MAHGIQYMNSTLMQKRPSATCTMQAAHAMQNLKNVCECSLIVDVNKTSPPTIQSLTPPDSQMDHGRAAVPYT